MNTPAEMNTFGELKYQRPDVAALKKTLTGYLKQFKQAKSYEEAKKAFLTSQDTAEELGTMAVIANIRNCQDKSDSFYEKEIKFMTKAGGQLMMLSKKANKALLTSRFRKDFEQEFGTLVTKTAEEENRNIKLSVIPIMLKEEQIGQAYSKTAALCKTKFRGEERNFYGLMKCMESTDREERREAFLAWAKLYEEASPKLEAQYAKLVKLRVKQAKRLGRKDYIELIYSMRERYDYKPADVENFRKQVLQHIVPACEKLYAEQEKRLNIDRLHFYDEALVFPEGNAVPQGTKEEMVAAARKMYRELSTETGVFFDFMTKHDLFDLETRPNKHLGGFCTYLAKYKAPFIFSNFNGTSADVDVLTHEAGHAFEFFVASRNQPISQYYSSTSEINEIHSMTMEHFTYPWMNLFFGENADKYRYAHLSSALKTIPYLVSVDEFQHRIFEKPDMTSKEWRAVWREIEQKYMPWRDYDGCSFLEEGGFWMQKQHIFLYPFYYIDYALAQICAFELYGKMKTDRDAAWQDYYRLCMAGGSKGYFELLRVANLHNPFEDGSVAAAVEGVLAELSNGRQY